MVNRKIQAPPEITEELKDWRGVVIGCIIICILGVAVRYPLLTRGAHTSDIRFFVNWANTIHQHGLTNVYNKSSMSPNYPVGFMHILYVFNKCALPFGEPVGHWTEQTIEKPFKVFLCTGDVVITICLIIGGYRLGGTARSSLLSGSCYILNPAVIMITGLWGQTNAIAIGFIIAAMIFLCSSRYWAAAYVLAALGCNTKLQVVPLLPLLPIATIFLNPQRHRKEHFKAVSLGAILFLVTTVILFSPFSLKGTAGQAISTGYLSHFETDPALNRNAWNPWLVCMPSEQHISTIPPVLVQLGRRVSWLAPIVDFLTYWHISILLFGTVSIMVYIGLAIRPSKENLFFAASAVVAAFFFLMTKIHERYLLDAIPLLLLTAVFDRRAFGLCGIVSMIIALNVEAVVYLLDLLAPVGVVILAIVLVRMILVILAPEAIVGWPWEIALRRKRLLDLPTVTYIIVGVVCLVFTCPWALWFSSITQPNVLYFDELPIQDYICEFYCPFRPINEPNNPILVVEGKKAQHGVAVPTKTVASFSIPCGYDKFCATVGISDQVPNDTAITVKFIVALDNSEVFRTEVVHPYSPGTDISIPLKQAKTIELIVLDPNKASQQPNTGDCRCLVWMNARIEKGLRIISGETVAK